MMEENFTMITVISIYRLFAKPNLLTILLVTRTLGKNLAIQLTVLMDIRILATTATRLFRKNLLTPSVCPLRPKIIYTYYRDEKTWNDANMACLQEGGFLASIHSLGSNRLVQNQFSKLATDNIGMWIGFSYTASGFQWTDKTEFAYTNWAKGEPSGDYDGTG